MLYITIDYGIDTMELPTYVVVRKDYGITDVLEHGLLSDFRHEDYDGLELQVLGEQGDLERFRQQFEGGI